MAQQEIEVILLRQLATHLAMPIFIVDQTGNLIFYNEPAEKILGRRFEETGVMKAEEWGRAWTPSDESGAPMAPDELPLTVALDKGEPAHRRFWIRGLDGVARRIEAVAFPLIGAGRSLGAAVMFWEQPT
jgi:PAS domain-containing protein